MSLAEDQFINDEIRYREAAEARRQAVEGPAPELESDISNKNLVYLILNGMFLQKWFAQTVGGFIGEQGMSLIAYYAARNHPGLRATAEIAGGIIGTLAGDPAAKALVLKHLSTEEVTEAANAIERVLSKEGKGKIAELNKGQLPLGSEFTERTAAPEMTPQRQLELPLKEPVLTAPRAAPGATRVAEESPQMELGMEMPTARQTKNQVYKGFREALASESDEHAERQVAHANQLSKRGQWWYTQFVNATLLWPRVPEMKILTDIINQPMQVMFRAGGVASYEGPTIGLRIAQAAMTAWKDTFPEAWKFMKIAFREDRPAFMEDILKLKPKLGLFGSEEETATDKDLIAYGNPYVSGGFRWIHAVVSAGRKGTMAADQFAKAMAYRANMRIAAYMEALAEADKEGLSESAKVLFADSRADQLMAKPTDSMTAKALQNMFQDTFTAHGPLIKQLNELANSNILARIGAPYITVPGNIIRQGLQLTPLAPFTERATLAVADTFEQRTALAKMVAGMAFMSWMADKVSKGELTGHGPQGTYKNFWPGRHHPQSIKIGDNWYGYERIGPVAEVMSMTADATEMYYMSKDPNAQSRTIDAVFGMVAQHISDAPFVEWLGNMKHVLDNARAEESGKSAEEYITRAVSGFVPAPIREWARYRDPTERVATVSGAEAVGLDPTTKFAKDVVNEIGLSIPGWSDNRPPKRDNWGNPIYPPTAMHDDHLATLPMRIINSLSPVEMYGKQPQIDPVEEEMFRHHIAFGEHYDKIWGTDPNHTVPVHEADQDAWRLAASTAKLRIKDQMLNQHDALEWMFNQNWYKTAHPNQQSKYIYSMHKNYYENAKVPVYKKYMSQIQEAAKATAAPMAPMPTIPGYVPGSSMTGGGVPLPPPTEEPKVGVR